jgi:hypothetical protein
MDYNTTFLLVRGSLGVPHKLLSPSPQAAQEQGDLNSHDERQTER